MCKLSIIVPVYNSEKYLRRCINSLIEQKRKDYEIILVDDGSLDSSGEICDSYERKMGRKIRAYHIVNSGVAAARNFGIKQARGKYIGFVDSDDWIEKDTYDMFIEYMDHHLDVDVCVGGMVRNYGLDREMPICGQGTPKKMSSIEAVEELFKWKWFRWELCDKLYRKKLFQNFTCNESLYVCEDLWSNWELFNIAQSVFYYPLGKYHYYVNPASTTEKYNVDKDTAIDVFEHILESEYLTPNIRRYVLKYYVDNLLKKIREMFFFNAENYKKEIEDILRRFSEKADSISVELEQGMCLIDENCYSLLLSGYNNNKTFFDKLYRDWLCSLWAMFSECQVVYIYGTGTVAMYVSEIMRMHQMECDAYVVGNGQPLRDMFLNKKVVYLSQIKPTETSGIVIAVSNRIQKSIFDDICRQGFSNVLKIDTSYVF